LDLDQSTHEQLRAVDQFAFNQEDPCLQLSAQYMLYKDRYIMEVEEENRRYWDMLFR
jgi:hypothetical protein